MDIHTDSTETLNAALRLLADIREAAGDPEGKLMQDELVARIRRMREGLESIASEDNIGWMTRFRSRKIAQEALQ